MHMGQLGHVGLGAHNSACRSPDSLLPLAQGRCLAKGRLTNWSVQCLDCTDCLDCCRPNHRHSSTHKPAPHKPSSCERLLPVPITSDEFWHNACVGASKALAYKIFGPRFSPNTSAAECCFCFTFLCTVSGSSSTWYAATTSSACLRPSDWSEVDHADDDADELDGMDRSDRILAANS